MRRKEKASISTREIIIRLLTEKENMSFKEIVRKVMEEKKIKPASVQRQLSSLEKMGIIESEGEKGDKKYRKSERFHPETSNHEPKEDRLRRVTSGETEALRSVIQRIAPLLVDSGETIQLYDLLGRVHDLDRLVASHNLSDGYLTVARLCIDLFQRYPDIFEVESDSLSSNPLRTRITVKDPLGLLLVRYVYDDKEVSRLLYFKDKQDYYIDGIIESVRHQNKMLEEIDMLLQNDLDLRYVARILALKRASPRWIFGYEFEEGINKINALLERSKLRFEIESEDRLRVRVVRKSTKKDDDELRECIDDLDQLFEELSKFFHHPYYALMPNPFDKEPDLWKHYADSFFKTFSTWFSTFRTRYRESKGDLDFPGLLKAWNEFCLVLKNYCLYAQSFRSVASIKEQLANIPSDIIEKFNTDFIEEFNHVLLRKLDDYAMKFEKASGYEVPYRDIKPIKPIQRA